MKKLALAIILIAVACVSAVPKFIGKGDESAPYILNPWTDGCMVNIRIVDTAGKPVPACNVWVQVVGGNEFDLVPTNSDGYSVDYYEPYGANRHYGAIKGARTGQMLNVTVWPNDGGGNMWIEITLGD